MSDAPAAKLPPQSFAAEPVHGRLADLCRKAIIDGEFQAGERFPSERELAERYSVSRATANKVLSTLIAEGLLEFQKGIGSRVRRRRTLFASLRGMESFTSHALEQGLAPSTEVAIFEHCLSGALPESVRSGLGLTDTGTEPVVYVERLRLADGIPLILEHRWVRESLAPGLTREDVAASFYRALEEKYGLPMTGERHTVSAVLLDPATTALFQETGPLVALRVEGTGFVQGGIPLWYQQLYYRGDRYQLHNETRGPLASPVELRLHEERRSA